LFNIEPLYLSISFISPRKIRALNLRFLNKDSPTDVLSFPQIDWSLSIKSSRKSLKSQFNFLKKIEEQNQGPLILGDIVLCPFIAMKNAKKIGQSLDREICFLLVHGFLHLCGFDHTNVEDEKKMLYQQQKIMKLLAEESPHPLWTRCVQKIGT
jgi:probable rRNA maturation factor